MNLKDHPKLLWAIVAISTACFVVSAVLLYLSRKQILDMVEKYYARSLEQVGLLSLRVPDPRARVATQIFMDHGVGGLTMGCRRGALTSTTFANAITAVLGGLGGAVFLFRIDLPLTTADYCFGTLGGVVPLSADHSSGEERQGRGEGSRGVEG